MSKKGSHHRQFSDEFKLSVVEESLTGSFSIYSLCKKHSIRNGSLQLWLRTFAPEYEFNSAIMGTKEELLDKEREKICMWFPEKYLPLRLSYLIVLHRKTLKYARLLNRYF